MPADSRAAPPKRKPRHSYNEDVNEPDALIEREPTDVEGETPAEDNAPVEQTEEAPNEPPMFEE
jgi:hypothetical protein